MDEKTQRQLEDLADLAYFLPDDWCADELWDLCHLEALATHKALLESVPLDQLEFLHAKGYSLERLKEMVKESSNA